MRGTLCHERSDRQFPRDYLPGCLLLLVAESPTHGYDLVEQICAFGIRSRDSARVYRALRTMEHEGLVVSQWEHSANGPARRKYRPTALGEEWLTVWVTALAECNSHFSACLARHQLVDRTPTTTDAAAVG